jgi:hypothetical protein
VTFSASTSGNVTLWVYLYNSGGCAGLTESKVVPIIAAPPAPTGLTATAGSSNSVNLVWNQVTGSSIYYTVYRSSSTAFGTFSIVGCTQVAPTAQSPFVDAAFVNSNASYLYKVKAASGTFDSGCPSPVGASAFSNIDVATTVTIPAIVSQGIISADHINALRTAAVALHKLANGASATLTFTDPTIGHCATDPTHCVGVKAVHVNELRSAVTADRQTLGLPAVSFTDPVLTSCASQCYVVKAVHFTDLQNAIK